MQLRVSFVKNTWDNKPKDEVLSFDELCKIFKEFKPISSKKNIPGIISGHFEGNLRKTENLKLKSLLILDVDFYKGEINDLEVLIKRNLGIYRYIAYSTFSHSINTPKIRIILFFSEEVNVADYKKISWNFIQSLEMELQEAIDMNSSIRPNQIMYLPVKPNDKYIPWSDINVGQQIEVKDYLVSPNSNLVTSDNKNQLLVTMKNNPLDISDITVENCLENYNVEDTDYYEWLEVGAALHHQYKGTNKGLNLWNEWSKKDTRVNKYRGIYDLRSKWDSFNSNSLNPVTFATILYKIKKNDIENEWNYAPLNPHVWMDTRGKNRTPIFTEANFRILLKEYNIKLKFDEIKKMVEISFNDVKWDDLNNATTRIRSLCELNNMKHNYVYDMVDLVGKSNSYNSWKNWVCQKPWDGIKRFNDLCDTVEVSEEYKDIKDLYLKKWFLQLIHITCLNDDGEDKVARMILIFQSKQHAAKTSWFRSLVPFSHKFFIAEALSIKLSDDNDVLKCIQHVLVELGEISSTMKKSNTEDLKNFLSSTKDILKVKYVTYPVTFRRRTVFFGSVNEKEFLQDQTGNTRFLCLPVIKCNHMHNIDMQQVYAELLHMAKSDSDYGLSDEDLVVQEKINNMFRSISILEEKLLEVFEVENYSLFEKKSCTKYTATNLLEELGFNINQMLHKKGLVNEMAKILDSYNIHRSTNPRGWYIPPKKLQDYGF